MKRSMAVVAAAGLLVTVLITGARTAQSGREAVVLGGEADVWEPDIAAVPGDASRVAVVGFSAGEAADVAVSSDYGRSWTAVPEIANAMDATVEADDAGAFWISYLGAVSCVAVSRIAPGSVVPAAPPAALPSQMSCDKPMLHVDTSPTSATYGRIYVAWLQWLNHQIVLAYCDSRIDGAYDPARCDDAGNWDSEAVKLSTSGFNDPWSPDIATAPDGTLYLVWGTRLKPSIQGTTCEPGAALSCQPPQTVAITKFGLPCSIPSAQTPGRAISNAPTIDIDISKRPTRGFVYVTWADVGVGSPCASIGGVPRQPADANTQDINAFMSVADGRLPSVQDSFRLYEDGDKDDLGVEGAPISDDFYPTVDVDRATGEVWVALYSSRLDATRATNATYVLNVRVQPQGRATPGSLHQVSTVATGFEPGHRNNYGEYMGFDVACRWPFVAWIRQQEGSDAMAYVPVKPIRNCPRKPSSAASPKT